MGMILPNRPQADKVTTVKHVEMRQSPKSYEKRTEVAISFIPTRASWSFPATEPGKG